jgi:sulfopyruvate decarboxylase TPP-binding subunit
MKALDFWKGIYGNLGFVLFSGVPCKGFKSLYDNMTSDLMFYVPAVDIKSALGIISGASMANYKACVICDISELDKFMYEYLNFNKEYDLPLTFIINFRKQKDFQLIRGMGLKYVSLTKDYERDLKRLFKKMNEGEACALMVKEGLIE